MRPFEPWKSFAHETSAAQRRVQDARLARYVQHEVYPFSAYYRRVFDMNRVDPRSMRGVDDLRRLPFTTKQDLLAAQSDPHTKRDFVLIPTPELIRAHWPLARVLPLLLGGASAKDRLRRAFTPNFVTFTTGRSSDPVVFAFTPHDLEILGEVGGRMFDVHGVTDVNARLVSVFPFAPHLAFWQTAFAGFASGRLTLSTGGGKVMGTSGNIRLVVRTAPDVLIGTPGYVYHMLREARDQGAKLATVKLVVLGAEKVTPGLKAKMSECLAEMGSKDVVISGTYGFTEARMAFSECPAAHDVSPGYHIYPDLGVFEVIDTKTLEPVGEGETGELVYTPIGGHGTVVMRYRTGDIAVGGITHEPCPHCGRTVPRIASELKRASDQRALALTKIKGTLVDLSAMGSLLSNVPEIEEWQVVLQKRNDDPLELDEFVLRLALRNGTDAPTFEKHIRRELLEGVEVSPNAVTFLPRQDLLEMLGMDTEMKEKRFLDRRPK